MINRLLAPRPDLALFMWFGPLAIYAGALGLAGYVTDLNYQPDFASYYRLAEYWAAGQTDLAVSGHWGPMTSWLMAPFVEIVDDPFRLGAAVIWLGGTLFIVASVFLYRVCGLTEPVTLIGGVGTALLAANWSVRFVTPDLLFSAALIAGFALFYGAMRDRSWAWSLMAGAVFGVSYLIKPAGIALGTGALVGLSTIAVLLNHRNWRTHIRRVGIALGAMLVVSLPWIAALSSHYGALTVTKVMGPVQRSVEGAGIANWEYFHTPREGRLNSWEDPSEIETYGGVELPTYPTDYVVRVGHNIWLLLEMLFDPQWIGVFLLAVVALFWPPWRTVPFIENPWRWGALAAAIIIAPYLLSVTKNERYFYACLPLGISASLGLMTYYAREVAWSESGSRAFVHRYGAAALVLVFAFSVFAAPVVRMNNHVAWNERHRADAAMPRARLITVALADMGLQGPTADVGRLPLYGLYVSLFGKEPYYGRQSDNPDVTRALELGARVIFADDVNAPVLSTDPRLQDVTDRLPASINEGRSTVHVFVPVGKAMSDGPQ